MVEAKLFFTYTYREETDVFATAQEGAGRSRRGGLRGSAQPRMSHDPWGVSHHEGLERNRLWGDYASAQMPCEGGSRKIVGCGGGRVNKSAAVQPHKFGKENRQGSSGGKGAMLHNEPIETERKEG